MRIQDAITGHLHVCAPEANLQSVAAQMVEHDCGAIPVVAEGVKSRPLGVVTERDIVARSVARGEDPRDLHASDAMTVDPVTIRRDEDLERGMELMARHQVRRLLVVDENDDLAGVLSLGDVARTRPDRATARTVEDVCRPSGDASGPAPS